ncbi:MAG: aa3-type cytochrome c oxidase subunit IV [Pseudomonadota bacterium]
MGENSYKPGQMDVTEQEKTFEGFIKWSIRVGIICIAIILFLAIFAS